MCSLSGTHANPTLQSSSGTSQEINLLFDDEFQQVQTKLKWHGERLTEDTVYAAAVSGLTWYSGWEQHRLFSLSQDIKDNKTDPNKRDLILREAEDDYQLRHSAWQTAKRSGRKKEAIALGISLVLASGADKTRHDISPYQFVRASGVDIERVCLGILQAPESLKGFANYWYAAADILSHHANPRLLPYLLHLANSDDTFLRSRAVAGLGIVGFQNRSADPPDCGHHAFFPPLHEYGLSVGERKLLMKELIEGVQSDKYLIRAAAALALSLVAEDQSQPLLLKLSKDRAYILSPEIKGNKTRQISFPVRLAAAIGLKRYGVSVNGGSGEFSGKALDAAKRGGQEVTNDHRNLRKDPESIVTLESSEELE